MRVEEEDNHHHQTKIPNGMQAIAKQSEIPRNLKNPIFVLQSQKNVLPLKKRVSQFCSFKNAIIDQMSQVLMFFFNGGGTNRRTLRLIG